MTKVKTPSVTLGLYITEVPDTSRYYSYFQLRAYPVTIGPTVYEQLHPDVTQVASDAVRNVSDNYGSSTNGLRLDGLTIEAQGNNDDRPRRVYGFECQYRDVYAVDLHKATAFAKTLTAIDRRLDKIASEYGRPQSFGQYVLHVAKAIGATTMIFRSKRDTGRSSSFSEMDLQVYALADGASRIDSTIFQWIEAGTQATAV